jgi:radial spoke head protein 4A
MATNYEEALQLLKTQDESGENLYEHLSDCLHKIIVEKPNAAYDIFQSLSDSVKQQTFLPPAPIEGCAVVKAQSEGCTAQLEWTAATEVLLDRDAQLEEEGDEPAPQVQNLPAELGLLQCAGVSFGAEETYRVHRSLLALAKEQQAKGMRLWGKIFGIRSDYLIAEGQVRAEAPPADASLEEPASAKELAGGRFGGNGCTANKNTYWVCSFAGGDWSKLPTVTSAQLVAAKRCRKTFTGILAAPVVCHPPFPGKDVTEANLLRSQIALISSSATIVPAGLYEAEEDENAPGLNFLNPPEEKPEVTVEGLSELGGWVHLEPEVNAIGRCIPLPPPEDEEAEAPEEPELRAALSGIGEDPGADDEENPIWQLRVVNRKVAVVASLTWPGAYAAGDGASCVNVYVGWGSPYSKTALSPPGPEPLQGEWKPDEEDGEPWEDKEEGDVVDDPGAQAEDEEEDD